MLIHPPVAKPSEPPPGIPALLASLPITIPFIDANLEGLEYLLKHNGPDSKAQAENLWRNRFDHWQQLQDGRAFASIDHYNRLVSEIERVLASGHQARAGLADYIDAEVSPADSQDLLDEARNPERNVFYQYFTESLMPQIEASSPSWIGLSVNFLSQALPAFALIGLIKNRLPQTSIVLGGGLITSWMALESWQNPFSELVDHCVAGAGEHALCRFLEVNCRLSAPPIYDDNLIRRYLSPGPVLPLATSRGCLWHRCAFCPETAQQSIYVPQKIESAVFQTQQLCKTHEPTLLHFVDSALSPAFLKRLTQSGHTTAWYGYARFDDFLLSKENCMALKQSGCVMLKLGLESGSQKVLNGMNKGIDIEKAAAVLENLREAEIDTFIYVLFGTPVEDEAAAHQTLEFVTRHHEAITYMNTALFLLPKHARWASELKTVPFSDGDLSLYLQFDHPLGWQRPDVRHFIDRIWKRHPHVAAINRITPKVFTSNHAPFFSMRGLY